MAAPRKDDLTASIVQLRADGVSIPEIAKRYDFTPQNVHHHLKKHKKMREQQIQDEVDRGERVIMPTGWKPVDKRPE